MLDRNGNELNPKDLIMISAGNYLHPGIFKRPGRSGNLNYYPLGEYTLNILKTTGKTRSWHLATSWKNEGRYIKISSDLLTCEEKVIYDEMIKLL